MPVSDPGRPREPWTSDERFQQLVELAPDGIVVHDGERVVLANASAVRLAGATHSDQLVGLPIDLFLDPPHLKAIQTELTGGGPPAGPTPPVRETFHRLDRSDVSVEVRAVAFLDHEVPSAHLIIRDITPRLTEEQAQRELEVRVQRAQRVEAVGALAGGVAHEVNNMMAVVLASSEFLLEDTRMPAECLEDVREIMTAAGRAAAVVRQLLAFGRRAINRPRHVDLASFVSRLEPTVQRLLGDERHLVVAAGTNPVVWADPNQLEQVLIALVMNARDATPAGGTVTLTVSEATLPREADTEAIPGGTYATLTMQDTGMGMDAPTRERIFEPFFTTKPVGEGVGLGLAAAQGIVTQNEGYIAVVSSPGQGAVFTVYLPARVVVDAAEEGSEPPRVGTGGGTTVLVVDDEAVVRAIVARSLERGNFQVLQAAGGEDALESIRRDGPPHLLITDLMMPGIGGVELARRVRGRWTKLPILFMTGYSADELSRRGPMFADADLVRKPFTIDGLLSAVAAALARSERGAAT